MHKIKGYTKQGVLQHLLNPPFLPPCNTGNSGVIGNSGITGNSGIIGNLVILVS